MTDIALKLADLFSGFADKLSDLAESQPSQSEAAAPMADYDFPGYARGGYVRERTDTHTYSITVPAWTLMPTTGELERLVREHYGVTVTITQ